MAGALRIQYPGGRYHVTARGNERREIFGDETNRFHLVECRSNGVMRTHHSITPASGAAVYLQPKRLPGAKRDLNRCEQLGGQGVA